MKKRLLLFRHGETDFNREHRFQGHLDVPLNDEGRRQAARLTEPLRRLGCQEILSSDLSRATETAQIAGGPLGIRVVRTKGLREAFLGEAQGLTVEEIEARYGSTLVSRWKSPYTSDADVSYPGGETGSQVLERVLRSLGEHLQTTRAQCIGISTHGGVIRRTVRSLLPVLPGQEAAPIPIPNGILYTLQWDRHSEKLTLIPYSIFKGEF
ncbi:MAG: histidine phosphatase family protein [Oligoflexia bacterium]